MAAVQYKVSCSLKKIIGSMQGSRDIYFSGLHTCWPWWKPTFTSTLLVSDLNGFMVFKKCLPEDLCKLEWLYTPCILVMFTLWYVWMSNINQYWQENVHCLWCYPYFIFVIVSFLFPSRKYDSWCNNIKKTVPTFLC